MDREAAKLIRQVPEIKYLQADNVARYRLIINFFNQEYKRLHYWLKLEEIYEGVLAWDVLHEYTLEQCQNDLEQLVEWRNLASRHDGGRATTIEEFRRKKMQYLLTPYTIEIERLLESLEKVSGYGGSLESTIFETIDAYIQQIATQTTYRPGEAGALWEKLHHAFVQMHENAADYIASLQTARAEEMMKTDAFLIFKDKLTDYLRKFVHALQRSSYQMEANLLKITPQQRDHFLRRVVADERDKPRIEEGPAEAELLSEVLQGWNNIRRWFLGNGHESSELVLLENATKETIARIVRSVLWMQEQRRAGVSRRKELDYLGRWFAKLNELDEAHQLAAFTFGLFPTRQLQGEDIRQSDRADISMWEEDPMPKGIRSRSRGRISKRDTEPMVVQKEQKQKMKQRIWEERQIEAELLEEMIIRQSFAMSELEVISTKTRQQLLQWIGRCLITPSHMFHTPEGVMIQLQLPQQGKTAILSCEDGELVLPDYQLQFLFVDANQREVAATGEGK